MFRIFHLAIVAYFLCVCAGCAVKTDPYYGDPSNARGFDDLSSFGSGTSVISE